MLEIIAHRGLWNKQSEKNSRNAIKSALEEGFGLETDIRDLNGDLVISHDVPISSNENIYFEELLDLYDAMRVNFKLALNIKSDGLSDILEAKLKNRIDAYFCFDMSVPDTLAYRDKKLKFYTRQSEHETNPPLYDDACGVWMDEFYSSWITEDIIKHHQKCNKGLAIVSPELHGRDYLSEWEKYRSIMMKNPDLDLILCTDFPLQARSYFG